MARQIADRIKEFTNTQGTGPITLTGAIQGYGAFADAFGDGANVYYGISTGQEFEIGYGTYAAPSGLSRDTVYAKLEGGVYEKNPVTPLDIQNGAEVYAAFTQAAWDEIVASIADLSGVQDQPTARSNLGFIDEILDKKAPGDIGTSIQSTGSFSRLSIGTAALNGALHINSADPRIVSFDANEANSYTVFAPQAGWGVWQYNNADQALMTINPTVVDQTGLCVVSLFRNTNTSGNREFRMYAGDGSGAITNLFSSTPGAVSYIDNGGNLGIGTNVPAFTIDAQKTLAGLRIWDNRGISNGFDAQDNGNYVFIKKKTVSGFAFIGIDPEPPAGGIDAASIAFFRYTNTTGQKGLYMYKGDQSGTLNAQIGVDGLDTFFNGGGNVGIGTSSPIAPLDIRAGNISPPSGQIEVSATGYKGHWAMDGGAMYLGHNSSSHNLAFRTNNQNRMIIHGSSDSVAIGANVNSGYGLTTAKGININDPDTPLLYLNTGVAGQNLSVAYSGASDYGYAQCGTWGSDPKDLRLQPGGGITAVMDGFGVNTATHVFGAVCTINGITAPFGDAVHNLGTSGNKWLNLYVQNAPVVGSDKRQKENIQDLDTLDVMGLIMGLRPVSFTHKLPTQENLPNPDPEPIPQRQKMRYSAKMGVIERPDPVTGNIIEVPGPVIEAEPVYDEVPIYDEAGNPTGRFKHTPVMEDDPTIQPIGPPGLVVEKDNSTHFGFIAQEVETLLNSLGIDPQDFAPLTYDSEVDRYGFRYSEMIALMVEHMQAQQHTINDLNTRLTALEGA